ncbi:MAG TPA: TonB-dependent receptor plug domain-containing protein, partial [Fermentimonas sp.]|nr:TonB-dependent receptor plug domain-containing protein [Fermentimonas sp.]
MKCNLHIITLATLFCLILGVSIEAKGNPKQSSVTIKGLVLDELNIPIIGANITEKGTLNGTISDVDGNFVLQVNNENAVLVVSYIGYRTVEQSVIADQQMRIVLSEDTRLMDEVVVIGYGTQKRADVTSSVSSVKSESFNKGAVLDAGQLVQGKVAGLQISLPTGDPTASTSVMLRGTSTLMGSTHPLILVDGVPGSFSTVAPEDIESIDVLKDGSATAIYGTRGTNGVIIITTKGGRRNMPTTIEYNGYVSISQQARIADFMSADDLRQRWSEGFEFSGA